MKNISLEKKEIDLIKMALRHCMDTCKKGGKSSGCTDCEKVEELLNKFISY